MPPKSPISSQPERTTEQNPTFVSRAKALCVARPVTLVAGLAVLAVAASGGVYAAGQDDVDTRETALVASSADAGALDDRDGAAAARGVEREALTPVSDLDAAVNAALLEGRAKFDTEEQARKEAEAAAQAKAQAEAEEQARKDAEEKAATAAAEAKAKAAQEKAAASAAEEKKKQGSFVAPVPGSPHGSYGNSGSLWSHGHTGEDFSASTGTSVRAITAGTVVSTGWGGAYGNEVVIKHADGKYSQYGHLSSISVSTGQTVGAGAQIALSGATGNVTGPHLHFEIRTTPNYGSDVNPVAYLRAHGVNV